eukprot:5677345-Alexandrium_andersonii.AAC.1
MVTAIAVLMLTQRAVAVVLNVVAVLAVGTTEVTLVFGRAESRSVASHRRRAFLHSEGPKRLATNV